MSFLFYPLSYFVRPGKGDDVVVTIDRELDSKFGSIGIGNNRKLFHDACRAVLNSGSFSEPVMVGVVDPGKNDAPKIFTNEVITLGKKHHLAVIFNAEFDYNSTNDFFAGNSFRLVMSDRLDKNGIFSGRIVFSPGNMVVWSKNSLRELLV